MASAPAAVPRRLRALLLALAPALLAVAAACALAHSEDEAQSHALAEKPGGPSSLPPMPSAPPLLLPAPAPTTHAPVPQPGGEVAQSISDVAEAAVKSVVNISTTRTVHPRMSQDLLLDPFFREFFGRRSPHADMRQTSLGSGVIVTVDGVVLTNNHVVEKATTIRIKLSDGREFDGKLVGADPRTDLAVVRLADKVRDLRPLPMADSDKVRLGEQVLAIGSPFGMSQTVTMGIVSAKGRADVGIADFEDFIQTDAAINPGNSGGALINLRGELIGLNTAILTHGSGGSQGVGFAIPSNMLRPITNTLLAGGKISRGWLGVAIQDLDRNLQQALTINEPGVLVSEVEAHSPAQAAGLKRGDVIVGVDGHVTDTVGRLRNLVAGRGSGAKVKVDVVRDGKPQKLEVTLGVAPERRTPVAGEPEEHAGLRGLSVVPLDESMRRHLDVPANVPDGLVIDGVAPDSPAASAGLQEGDVITQANRQPVTTPGAFAETVRKSSGPLLLLVIREGRPRYFAVAP